MTTTTTNTIEFNGRTLSVLQELAVSPKVKEALSVEREIGVEGKRGALGMLQIFTSGARRVVWITGKVRTENERP